MPATQYYSADIVRNLPANGNRYEAVHGELLVTPSPADVSWAPDSLVQPDLFVAAAASWHLGLHARKMDRMAKR